MQASAMRRRLAGAIVPRLLPLLMLAAVSGQSAAAQIREWTLVEPGLQKRTTVALVRYYTIVRPDSLRLRYLRTNTVSMPYRLRASRAQDSLGELLSISLGQLTLFSSQSLRVAFGEDLYRALLASRTDSGADERMIYAGDGLWENPADPHTVGVSLDRIDYRLSRGLGFFLQAGSPESNLPWWSDGTARAGVTTPAWEFAFLVPFAGGAGAVGPYRERLLAPGFGAAARLTIGDIVTRVRFAGVSDASFQASRAEKIDSLFVHTLSAQAAYNYVIDTRVGPFLLAGGIDYEEYAGIEQEADGTATQTRRVRRLSPLADVIWSDPASNVRLSVGVANLALRGEVSVRLTDALSLELRAVDNAAFRDPKTFEHPFLLFFTPQIRF